MSRAKKEEIVDAEIDKKQKKTVSKAKKKSEPEQLKLEMVEK